MNSVTPEHLVTVAQGASPVQLITMAFVGIIAICFVIAVVRWVVSVQMSSIPADLAAIRKELFELGKLVSKLQGDMWSPKQMDDHINSAILKHTENCPHHKQ